MPSKTSDRATSSAHEWKDKMGSWTSFLSLSLSNKSVYLYSLPVKTLSSVPSTLSIDF